MKTVGIICEYNPFHNGHLLQINKIKNIFGNDTRIVCVMSGNYTQRGECALLDKYTRAKIAVDMGVSLVLELPFPYSSSSAEFFADAGVEILDRLGNIDCLCFGCECGDTEKIISIAKNTLSERFSSFLSDQIHKPENKNAGYAVLFEKTYKLLFTNGLDFDIIRKANNILAIEYVKALIKRNSAIKPHAILRKGCDFSDDSTICEFSSAAAIRKCVFDGDTEKIRNSLPSVSYNGLKHAIENGEIHLTERIFYIISSVFRANPIGFSDIHDKSGIFPRIYSSVLNSVSYSDLKEKLRTKKFTDTRLSRYILYSLFGIESDVLRRKPKYTTVLAADSDGVAFLNERRKKSGIIILTKPSDYTSFTGIALEEAKLSSRADSIYSLTKIPVGTGSEFLRKKPYIKK